MRSKLNDACAMANRLRQDLRRLKLELLQVVDNKRFKQKRLVRQARQKIESLKHILRAKNEAKVVRYESLQKRRVEAQETSSFVIPDSLEKFKDLKIFSSDNLMVDGAEIDPPMVCDDDISLSHEELLLLSKGPKFSVRKDLKENEFKLEVEKSICKRKYSTFENPSLEVPENPEISSVKSPISDGGRGVHPPTHPPLGLDSLDEFVSHRIASNVKKMKAAGQHINTQTEHFRVSDQENKEKSLNLDHLDQSESSMPKYQFLTARDRKFDGELASIVDSEKNWNWESKKSQLVYNFEDSSVDVTKLKACNYKYVRSTVLPGAQDSKSELGHELRKQESLKVFQDLTDRSGKKYFPTACKSNLSPKEQEGLKSLKDRISKGELVVCQSDKSNKLCVLSRQQYIDAGLSHCKKDLEVNSAEVKRLQTYVNSHVSWLHDILGTGQFWGQHDRIVNSTNDQGCQVAPLKILVKDHKPWNQNSGKPVPSRPVVNGNGGFNCHLSEILSLILGPVAQEAKGSEINSTTDLLARVQKVNSQINSVKPNVLTELENTAEEDSFCDFCQECNAPEASDAEKMRAKKVIAGLLSKKPNSGLHITGNLKSLLKGSREATKLYHRC